MTNWQKKTRVERFDCVTDFALWIDNAVSTSPNSGAIKNRLGGDSRWAGGSFSDAVQRAQGGANEAAIAAVEAIVDQVEHDLPLTAAAGVMAPQIVGHLPHIPNYLSGVPDCMMAPTEALGGGPIRIAVDFCCSGSVSTETMQKRGAAIAAFAYLASTRRPVELFALGGIGPSHEAPPLNAWVPVVNLGVSPLDIASVTYALTDATMLRQLAFAMRFLDDRGYGVQWAWRSKPHNANYIERMREIAGLNEADLFFTGGYSADGILDDPVQWVRKQLDTHCEGLLAA